MVDRSRRRTPAQAGLPHRPHCGTGNRSLDVDLTATAYDLPAGHSLTLVVDTVDPLYYEENTAGVITVAGGSYVDIPLK